MESFKSWTHRFAEFVDGSPHLTEEEVMTYSTWSSDDEDRRYADHPDHLAEEMTDDEEVVFELGHRFWCPLCIPLQPGHRFTCGLCAFHSKGRYFLARAYTLYEFNSRSLQRSQLFLVDIEETKEN